MSRLKNLWGEPVIVWAAIQAVLVMMEAFGWLGGIGIHGQDAMAVLLVVLNALAAVHIAFVTHRSLLAPFSELVKALAGLGLIYGVHISTEQTGTFILAVTAIVAAFHQSQTSPIPPPPLDVPAEKRVA